MRAGARTAGSRDADPVALEDLAGMLAAARNPVLVAGPDIDASRRLGCGGRARREAAPGGVGDACAGRRADRLPGGAPLLPGHPAAGDRCVSRPSRRATSCWSSAPRCSPTTPTSRARCSGLGHDARADHLRPERGCARADGQRHRRRRRARARAPARAARAQPARSAAAARAPGRAGGQRADQRHDGDERARGGVADGRDRGGRAPPSSTVALRNRLRLSTPGSYYFSGERRPRLRHRCSGRRAARAAAAPGGVRAGRGISAVRITAVWSAATYRVPVTFLVLRNEEYSILKWFRGVRAGRGGSRPRSQRPGRGERRGGIRRALRGGHHARGARARALREAIAVQDGPRLVQVPVAPGMWLD